MAKALEDNLELCLEPDEELAPKDAVVLDVADVRKCKIVMSIKQARFGQHDGNRACLVVFEFSFVPSYQVRFKHVEVAIRVSKPKRAYRGSSTIEQPTVIAYEPKRWLGRRYKRVIRRSMHAGTNLGTLTRPVAGVEIGPTLGGERSEEYAEGQRVPVMSVPGQTTTEWHLSENELAHEGVSNPFRGALIIRCGLSFAVRISFRVRLSKPLDPISWRTAQARTTDLIPFDAETVADGIGPPVCFIDSMEDDRFKLDSFVITDWDL